VIRVVLPAHLKALAKVHGEVHLDVPGVASVSSVLDALEAQHPVLRGTIRQDGRRRAYVRYYACEQDLSHDPTDAPLPVEVVTGKEPFIVLGAMAGG
jgi:hypothetical protein